MSSTTAMIEVFGSLNADLVTTTSRMPSAGETITAKSFATHSGGKGANQAIACARLLRDSRGKERNASLMVRMVGAVGDDPFGDKLRYDLQDSGVMVDRILVKKGEVTGTAVIIVEEKSGDNRILVTPGTNGTVVSSNFTVTQVPIGLAVYQLEVPLKAVISSIKEARKMKRIVVLNPAPAIKLPKDLYPSIHCLIMNESEAALLGDVTLSSPPVESQVRKACKHFANLGVPCVIITMGENGVYHYTAAAGLIHTPAYPVEKVVDTTAAGDTFVGAFVVQLALTFVRDGEESLWLPQDHHIKSAVEYATRASSCTIQKAGAQTSIPWAGEVPPPGEKPTNKRRRIN